MRYGHESQSIEPVPSIAVDRNCAVSSQTLSVGILDPSPETRESLSHKVEETRLGSVDVIVDTYCTVEDDLSTRQLIESCPDIILVDLQDQRAGIKALRVLHSVLPEAWVCGISEGRDPQLIIEIMQAGAREFLSKPVSVDRLGAAFARCLHEQQRVQPEITARGKIYSVTSAKGGSGATSVVVNLATTLSKAEDARVAILDLNSPSGDASCYLNMRPQHTLSDALTAGSRLDPVMLQTLMAESAGLSLLSGPEQFRTGLPVRAAALARLFRVASQVYTHILVDFPCILEPGLLRMVTTSSAAILVVMTPELPSLNRTQRFLAFLVSSGCSGDRLRLILNRDNSRDFISVREITSVWGFPVYGRLPNDYRAAFDAITEGRPIEKSTLVAGYRKLAQDLTGVVLPKHGRAPMKLPFVKRHPRTRRLVPL